jgi:hypothetical protein
MIDVGKLKRAHYGCHLDMRSQKFVFLCSQANGLVALLLLLLLPLLPTLPLLLLLLLRLLLLQMMIMMMVLCYLSTAQR